MAQLIWTAPMRYYSPGDETAFFTWLQAIPGVIDVRGQGRQLIIRLRSKRLSAASLREFVALYHRYEGNMTELAQFANPTNAAWFNAKGPAYRAVFAAYDAPSPNLRMHTDRHRRASRAGSGR